jgi:bifunctional non-homologous end joining protein LigD
MARQAPHSGRANPRSVPVPQPMLARPSKTLPAGDDWVFEVKWDGIRIVARVAGGSAQLWSRGGNDVTERHAEIATALAEAVGDREAVIDGELCALDPSGRPSFSLFQQGGGSRVLYAFDLLELDGESLCDRPLDERRSALDELLPSDGDEVRISRLFDDGEGLLGVAREHGLEGVVAKRRTSTYAPGKRPGTWVKVKLLAEGDVFAVVGFTRGQGRRDALGALVLGERGPEGLVWAGNVGTGLTDAELDRLAARLAPLARPESPLAVAPKMPRVRRGDLTWVEPVVQVEVEYLERTHEGRLRAPVYVGVVDSGPDPLERPVAEVRDGKRTLTLKNLDKVWWPDEGITKGDVLDHYHALADVVGPHLRGRPFTMLRFPDGIAGKHFFQKDLPSHAPEWLHVAPLPAGGRTIRFPVLDDELSLLWAVNMGCFDLNVWCADLPERPDAVIFDLDPAPPAGFEEARQVALLIRDALASVDLRAYPRTSGSQRGLHVLVPIARRHTHGEARELVAAVGAALAHAHPRLVTTKWAKTERRGVLIDANQNGYGRTTAWAYSVRPRPGAHVATPVTWEELSRPLDPTAFTMRAVYERVQRLGDLHRPVLEDAQSLGKALKALR